MDEDDVRLEPGEPCAHPRQRAVCRVTGAPAKPFGGLLGGPPRYRPSSPWAPGAALLATGAIVLLSLGAAALFNFLRPHGARAGDDTAALMLTMATLQATAVVLTLLASLGFGGRLREVLALHAVPGGWRAYAGAIATLAGLHLILAAVQYSVLRHDMLTDLRPFVEFVAGPYWLLAAAVLGIGAPLSEELLFRGFLQSALAQSKLGFWGAAVVSTALWTALHWGYTPVGLAEVFAIGLLLSWLLWRTGSLRVAIFCHAVYNSLIVVVLRLVELPPA